MGWDGMGWDGIGWGGLGGHAGQRESSQRCAHASALVMIGVKCD
jgi:hypothetical protein